MFIDKKVIEMKTDNQDLFEYSLISFNENNYQIKCYCNRGKEEALNFFRFDIVTVFIQLQKQAEHTDKTAGAKENGVTGSFQIAKCATRQHTQIEGEHKAIAIVQPVWFLEAVPNEVDDIYGEAEEQNDQQKSREEFLLRGIFL